MICKHCGTEIDGRLNFCRNCGKPIEKAPAPAPKSNNENFTIKRSTAITVIAVIVAVAVIALLLIFTSKNDEKAVSIPDQPKEETVRETEPPKPVFQRFSTFGNYSYEKMPMIASSFPADDETCFELAGVIDTFNHEWENLVNTGSSAVFYYLRKDTQAYKYAEKYEKTDFTENFNLIDVNDVRYVGNTYFVWVHEIITEHHKSGDKTNEYHWIYKVGKDSSGYYVENYISDPYYN